MIDLELMNHTSPQTRFAEWSNLHVPILNSETWFVPLIYKGLAELERIRREVDAATASLLSTIADSRDAVANLSVACTISNGEASKRCKVAKVCNAVPGCLDLLAAGEISGEHVVALTPVVNKLGVAELLNDARTQSPEAFRDTVANFRLAGESGEQLAKRQHDQRSLRISTRPDGMVGITGVLPPVEGITLKAALEAIMDAKWRKEHPKRARKLGDHGGDTHEQRMCDALLSLTNTPWFQLVNADSNTDDAADSDDDDQLSKTDPRPSGAAVNQKANGPFSSRGKRARRAYKKEQRPKPTDPKVVIVFNVEKWQAELIGHGPIPITPTLFDLAKSDLYYAFTTMTGEILKLGRARKDPTPLQRLAVIARDRQCIFEGCTTPASRCEIHHYNEWLQDQGFTDVEVLGLLCKTHHRHIHVNDLKATPQSDGTVHITHRHTGELVAIAYPRGR